MEIKTKIKEILENSKNKIVVSDKGMVVEGKLLEITPLLEVLIHELYVSGLGEKQLKKIFDNAIKETEEIEVKIEDKEREELLKAIQKAEKMLEKELKKMFGDDKSE